MTVEIEIIGESVIITKVNSAGQKTRRVRCKPGYKLNDTGTSCVPIPGGEKATKRIALRKAVRTKAAGGQALKNRTNRKRIKAMRKRKALGL
jgi:hypothetical protein